MFHFHNFTLFLNEKNGNHIIVCLLLKMTFDSHEFGYSWIFFFKSNFLRVDSFLHYDFSFYHSVFAPKTIFHFFRHSYAALYFGW